MTRRRDRPGWPKRQPLRPGAVMALAARCAPRAVRPPCAAGVLTRAACSAGRVALQRVSRRTLPRCGAAAQPSAPAAASDASRASPPPSFRRLVAPRTGGSLREVANLVTLDTPSPGPGEVLLRVKYAGVNGGCETFRARGEHWFAANASKQGVRLLMSRLTSTSLTCRLRRRLPARRRGRRRGGGRGRGRAARAGRRCHVRRSAQRGWHSSRLPDAQPDGICAARRALSRSMWSRKPPRAGPCRRRRQRAWPAPSAA